LAEQLQLDVQDVNNNEPTKVDTAAMRLAEQLQQYLQDVNNNEPTKVDTVAMQLTKLPQLYMQEVNSKAKNQEQVRQRRVDWSASILRVLLVVLVVAILSDWNNICLAPDGLLSGGKPPTSGPGSMEPPLLLPTGEKPPTSGQGSMKQPLQLPRP
jgi:hypothetical protein